MKKVAIVLIALLCSTAYAQQACTKIGFRPGTPDPNKCIPASKPKSKPVIIKQTIYIDRTVTVVVENPALEKNAYSGIAQAASLTVLMPSIGKSTVNIGAASYGGQGAMGLTFAHRPSSNLILNGGVSFGSSGKGLVKAGVGFEF